MNIFVHLALTPAQRQGLKEIGGSDGLYFHDPDGSAIPPAELDECAIVFGNVPAQWIEHSPALEWVQLESVGFGEYASVLKGPVGKRVKMTNLAGFFSEPVAETALAGILALKRGIVPLVLLKDEARWVGDALRPGLRTLHGAQVVMFGRGAIAQRLEALLSPFGCQIARFGSDWTADALDHALELADVVIGSAPDTPATRMAFDRRRLQLLRPDAIFVNVGRGSLVDEEALADALSEGHLGGAVIDVTLQEPLPPDHRFWSSPNLILTQHTGGGTGDEIDRKIGHFAGNLARYRRGEPLSGLIDISRGY